MRTKDKAELLDAIFAYQNGMEVKNLSYGVSLVFEHMISFFEKCENKNKEISELQKEKAKKRREKQKSQREEEKRPKKQTSTPLSKSAPEDEELMEMVESFVENKRNYHQIKHQIQKNGKEVYITGKCNPVSYWNIWIVFILHSFLYKK